ncbi:WbqC family protein [Achromobacter sp. ES-001]|nr:WbqC family protein [Achromobacter sp. ES-001]
MYFPWVGMLEQIKHADVFVHYDDVQFARGFFNRVQIKTRTGISWLTVPLAGQRRGQLINEVQIDYRTDWRRSHLSQLSQAYEDSPFKADMLALIDSVLSARHQSLACLARASMDALVAYFPVIGAETTFMTASKMNVPGTSTQRLIDLCLALKAATYLTGHGARNYLDHEAFEAHGIDVSYMNYGCAAYAQLHGTFTPYVSALDLIANLGPDGVAKIRGQAVPWRSFLARSTE